MYIYKNNKLNCIIICKYNIAMYYIFIIVFDFLTEEKTIFYYGSKDKIPHWSYIFHGI